MEREPVEGLRGALEVEVEEPPVVPEEVEGEELPAGHLKVPWGTTKEVEEVEEELAVVSEAEEEHFPKEHRKTEEE